jgi:F-type H+-transporting ATPase subunit gamma
MANLKEIRNRISSVNSTMKITSAMKMVSAAKLKKAQDAITAMRPYSEKLTELMSCFSQIISSSSISYLSESRPLKNFLVVAISSNIGVCGAFYSNVIKHSIVLNNSEKFSNSNFSYLVIGKKANDVLSKTENVIENYSSIFDELTYQESSKITEKIIKEFSSGKFDHVEVVFNSFKNAANQIVQTEQYLPIACSDESEQLSAYIF